MPSRRLAQGSLRVTYPATHTLGRPQRDRDLGSTAEASHAALLDSLGQSDFRFVEEVQITPKPTRALDRGIAANPDPVRIALDVAAGEAAVVLVEQDGCYSWHLPAEFGPVTSARSMPRGQARRTVSFEIPLRHPAAPARASRRSRSTSRTRGLFGDLLTGVVRVTVLRFAAPVLVGKVIDVLERFVHEGIVHMPSPDPTTWTRVDRLDQVGLPTGRPARVLLFVHGTFSSTASAYGVLGLTDEGRAFLTDALARYDAVIGYDHKTLSVDPLANANDLLGRIGGVTSGVTVDVVCHSRGGLVVRSFAEQLLPSSGWNGSVDKVVFVAATNAGTNLANPERWHDLVDIVTNLTMVTAGVVAGLPGGAPVSAVVVGVVKGLGALVKYLVSYAADSHGGIPGLAAMTPGGPFVTGINQIQPGQPAPGTPWYVVSSNFHVTLQDLDHLPKDFPRELAVRLAEGLVDRIFRDDNDLVVDVWSMSSIDAAVGGFVAGTYSFGTNSEIYHVNYFGDGRFVAALRSWLLAAKGRSLGRGRSRGPARGRGPRPRAGRAGKAPSP